MIAGRAKDEEMTRTENMTFFHFHREPLGMTGVLLPVTGREIATLAGSTGVASLVELARGHFAC